MLADMRHAAHCRALRAVATQEAMRLAAAEAEADAVLQEETHEAPETSSDVRPVEAVKRGTGYH
jgi:hypothetical protein